MPDFPSSQDNAVEMNQSLSRLEPPHLIPQSFGRSKCFRQFVVPKRARGRPFKEQAPSCETRDSVNQGQVFRIPTHAIQVEAKYVQLKVHRKDVIGVPVSGSEDARPVCISTLDVAWDILEPGPADADGVVQVEPPVMN